MPRFAIAVLASTFCLHLAAQDSRHVSEPVVPPSCAVLTAQFSTPDETRPDTLRIQRAIDSCAAGHAVELKANGSDDVFVTGPLQLRSQVALRIDKGAILFGSRNPRAYDISPGSCGIVDEHGHGCKAILNGNGVNGAAVLGEGVIDGQGGAKLLNQTVSWWDLAQQAKVTKKNQNCPRILVLSHCNNFTLYRVTLRNSPNFHVYYEHGDGFTAWGVIINSPKTARNTDGIDPANSTNVTITHCYIHAGDDNVAIKAGGTGASTNMTIAHNHFYTGHGVSIGSDTDAGVSHIRVSDLTIDGADNGIRIKSNSSRGGVVQDVIYDDVCIRNTKNPILMDTHYSFYGKDRDKLPRFLNITLHNVQILGGGKLTFDGYDAQHPLEMTLDDVTVSGAPVIKAAHAILTLGPGPVNFAISGEDIHLSGHPAHAAGNETCAGKFVPMPQS